METVVVSCRKRDARRRKASRVRGCEKAKISKDRLHNQARSVSSYDQSSYKVLVPSDMQQDAVS